MTVPREWVTTGRGLLVTLMVMSGAVQMAALKTAADFSVGQRSGGFTRLENAVDTVVGYLQVLGIALGALGLVVAGLMLATGQQDGMTWGTRAGIGVVVALCAPGIID
jgi:hypothetical protein